MHLCGDGVEYWIWNSSRTINIYGIGNILVIIVIDPIYYGEASVIQERTGSLFFSILLLF